MSNKSQTPKTSANFETPKKGGSLKGKIRNAALVTSAVAATLVGFPSCNSESDGNISPKQETTEVIAKQPRFIGTDIFDRTITPDVDGIKGIILCENPETKQLFLSDGESKLTEDFDDIKEIGRFDGMLYYVGVDGGKCTIISEKGDTIISGLDEIEEYTIHNGNVAVSGKKNGKTCLIFNDKIIDEGREYRIHVNSDADVKNGIYVTATSYENQFTENSSKNVSTFVDGKKIGPDFSYSYYEDGEYSGFYNIEDYGEGYAIISRKGSSLEDEKGTLIYNGRIVGTNLNSLGRLVRNNNLINYTKNGKKYILFTDGKEYLVDKLPESDSKDSWIFVSDGKKSYYILDGKLYEHEGKGCEIYNVGMTSDGRFYFVGYNNNEKGESFYLDGKKIGTLEHITGVGTTKDGTVYLRGVEEEQWGRASFSKKNVIYINGTVREDLNPDNDPQEWLHLDDN